VHKAEGPESGQRLGHRRSGETHVVGQSRDRQRRALIEMHEHLGIARRQVDRVRSPSIVTGMAGVINLRVSELDLRGGGVDAQRHERQCSGGPMFRQSELFAAKSC
jgi:hypothetical protein